MPTVMRRPGAAEQWAEFIIGAPRFARAEPISACQLRAARALLNITADELAERSDVSLSTIRRAEKNGTSNKLICTALALALSEVEFVGTTGVKLFNEGRDETGKHRDDLPIGIP